MLQEKHSGANSCVLWLHRLVQAGLKADAEGDDFELIQELIEPPKQLGRGE